MVLSAWHKNSSIRDAGAGHANSSYPIGIAVLANYTFLTLISEMRETNVYAGPRSSILGGFSRPHPLGQLLTPPSTVLPYRLPLGPIVTGP
jgi:hypothetical protein